MKMSSKKRIYVSMKVRRRIFYVCCLVLICITFLTIAVKCNKGASKSNCVSVVNVEPKFNRYRSICIEPWELDEMASIIYLEARNQSAKGQQAVAEVILNRVLRADFPNSVSEVIHEGENDGVLQFTTVTKLSEARPSAEQYKAINAALYGKPIIPLEVVFFSKSGENEAVWGKIDDHIFCYAYKWE